MKEFLRRGFATCGLAALGAATFLMGGVYAPAFAATVQEATAALSADAKANLIEPDVDASVERVGTGDYTLHWKNEARSVAIYAGTQPDALNKRRLLTRVGSVQAATIKGLNPSTRYYFTLRFSGGPANGQTLTVAERFLPLKGAPNFRDMGGYRTENGQHTRWGMAYRSSSLASLTDDDLAYMVTNLKLHLVCDFRGPIETDNAPDRLPAQPKPASVNLAIAPGTPRGTGANAPTAALPTDIKALEKMMPGLYTSMLEAHARDVYGPFLAKFGEKSSLPMVYHCTAGKDRTGIGAALLLSILGVPEKTIVADYSLTNMASEGLYRQFTTDPRMQKMGYSPQLFAHGLVTYPAHIEQTLAYINNKYGSVENFLKKAAGLDDATFARIRANLLQ